MIEKIEILQHGKGGYFCGHPCEESRWLLSRFRNSAFSFSNSLIRSMSC